jgi:hypothetical protein
MFIMLATLVVLVWISRLSLFGINQSKNASSSATTTTTTDSGNDNSAYSHNTDNSVGAGASGPVSVKNNAIQRANNVKITDGSEEAIALAKTAVNRASRQASEAVAAATKFGADAFASQSRSIDSLGASSSKALDTIAAAAAGSAIPDQGKTRMIMYAVGGLVVLGAVFIALKKGR